MGFATFATLAIGLAFAAMAAAVVAGILVGLRRRELANRAFVLVMVLFAAATASAFGAATRSGSDLQAQTRAVLSLAASAERVAHARSGRYTTSIADLQRISPALSRQISMDGATLRAGARAPTRRVRLRAWIGATAPALLLLTFRARRNARPQRLRRGPSDAPGEEVRRSRLLPGRGTGRGIPRGRSPLSGW